MLRPLILTGGPAVGKSTCGRLLADGRPRAAFIDADDVRQLVVSGGSTLWQDAEGERQFLLAARNTAALATNLAEGGFDVVVADFVTASSLEIYRRELPACLVVALDIGIAGAQERASTRRTWLTDDEFALLHGWAGRPLAADIRVDVAGMTVAEQTARLRRAWTESSR